MIVQPDPAVPAGGAILLLSDAFVERNAGFAIIVRKHGHRVPDGRRRRRERASEVVHAERREARSLAGGRQGLRMLQGVCFQSLSPAVTPGCQDRCYSVSAQA